MNARRAAGARSESLVPDSSSTRTECPFMHVIGGSQQIMITTQNGGDARFAEAGRGSRCGIKVLAALMGAVMLSTEAGAV